MGAVVVMGSAANHRAGFIPDPSANCQTKSASDRVLIDLSTYLRRSRLLLRNETFVRFAFRFF
jgi:hypothetical protein